VAEAALNAAQAQVARTEQEASRLTEQEAALGDGSVEERARADARIATLERQAAFLGSSLDVDVTRVQLLMHQAVIYLGHVRSAIANAAHDVRSVLQVAASPDPLEDLDDVEDLLATIRKAARQASSSIAGASLSGDRLRTVLSFAPNIRVDLETDRVEGDLLQFLDEYFRVRLAGVPGNPVATFDAAYLTLTRSFSPVDIAVLVDNLVDNARKAKASKIEFKASSKGKDGVTIRVVDDGLGIDQHKVDAAKVFERGYSGAADGTGLGLYSVRTIVESMRGAIQLVGDGSRADFDIFIPGATE